jgi:pimeloyl-ACP methyl ester carboxylesterase
MVGAREALRRVRWCAEGVPCGQRCSSGISLKPFLSSSHWNPRTRRESRLDEAAEGFERQIFDRFSQSPREHFTVDTGPLRSSRSAESPSPDDSERVLVHTVRVPSKRDSSESSKPPPPLVLLHGFLSGSALWAANVDHLAAHHTTYMLDWPGFGRSARPRSAVLDSPERAEQFFVESLEAWREELGLESMMLVGHSMGGYLAAAYALRYPERVPKVVLADPWGMPVRSSADSERLGRLPFPFKLVLRMIDSDRFSPLAAMRLAGFAGYGPDLIKRARPDLTRRWDELVGHPDFQQFTPAGQPDAGREAPKLPLADYIYALNSRFPVGERAFRTMSLQMGWAARPMVPRLAADLSSSVRMKILLGEHSWLDATQTVQMCAGQSNISAAFVGSAGHHVYVDNHRAFNRGVTDFTAAR